MNKDLKAYECSMRQDYDLEISNSTGAYRGMHYNVNIRKGGVTMEHTDTTLNEVNTKIQHNDNVISNVLRGNDEVLYKIINDCPDDDDDDTMETITSEYTSSTAKIDIVEKEIYQCIDKEKCVNKHKGNRTMLGSISKI